MNKSSIGYKMIYDYHTHTVFSHGKATIEENVMAAREKGLKAIAITDHGPGHLTYGIKRSSIPEMRNDINRLKTIYNDIEIYLGVEANIVNNKTGLDISPEEVGEYDFVIAGYHYGVLNGYCLTNFINSRLRNKFIEKKMLVKNTDMALRAIYENDLKILTHPGDKGPFDIAELAKACADRNTLMEISTWHDHLTVDEIKIASKYGVKFIISSDAHSFKRIGDFENGLIRALEAGLDITRIVNIEREV